MKIVPLVAAAVLALSVGACGSDQKKDDAPSLSGDQTDLPKCEEVTAPGQPVDAAIMSQPKDGATGVCTYTDDGEETTLAFMWSFKCEDGRTFVYSKENRAMGFDGEEWQEATDEQIDNVQSENGCWGGDSDEGDKTSDHATNEPAADDSAGTASAGGGGVESACNVYAKMKFNDADDEAAAKEVWTLHDELSGAVAALADAHHKAWSETDYDAAASLPTLWPAMQKQCAQAGVTVQDAGWDY